MIRKIANVDIFKDMLYHYRAELIRVIDGDTIHIRVDQGLDDERKIRIRFKDINAPELFSGLERDRGAAARDHLAMLLSNAKDGVLFIETFKDTQSYGRFVAFVYIEDKTTGNWFDVGQRMVDDGFAVVDAR